MLQWPKMQPSLPRPLVQSVDALQIPVPDIDAGLAFYRDRLGHRLLWRTETAAGLAMPDTETEIVIQTERQELEANLKVASVADAVARFSKAGGRVLVEPFDIQIGRCAIVEDPWSNRLVILDATKGSLVTDAEGNVTGVAKE